MYHCNYYIVFIPTHFLVHLLLAQVTQYIPLNIACQLPNRSVPYHVHIIVDAVGNSNAEVE